MSPFAVRFIKGLRVATMQTRSSLGNKVRAVRLGIVVPLMRLLMDPGGGMVDEALAILAILSSHQEGKVAIGQASPIPVLVEVLKTGSPRNKENAAVVLYSLCTANHQHLSDARDVGAEEALKELAESGTDRAKRKAGNLLDLINQAVDMTDYKKDGQQVLPAQ